MSQVILINNMTPTIAEIEKKLEKRQATIDVLLGYCKLLKTSFRQHPLGFISCTLITEGNSRLRLHYWPTIGEHQQSENFRIHNHKFNFKSWVLLGSIVNVLYDQEANGSKLSVYETVYIDDKSILIKTVNTIEVVEKSRSTYSIGDCYTIDAGQFHLTLKATAEPAFTVLITTEVDNVPLVLGPISGQDLYEYSREEIDVNTVVELLTKDGLLESSS